MQEEVKLISDDIIVKFFFRVVCEYYCDVFSGITHCLLFTNLKKIINIKSKTRSIKLKF
jgi:hypothetical protein